MREGSRLDGQGLGLRRRGLRLGLRRGLAVLGAELGEGVGLGLLARHDHLQVHAWLLWSLLQGLDLLRLLGLRGLRLGQRAHRLLPRRRGPTELQSVVDLQPGEVRSAIEGRQRLHGVGSSP